MISQNDYLGGGAPLDTSNKFAVGVRDGKVVILAPPAGLAFSAEDWAIMAAIGVAISNKKDLLDRAYEAVTSR